MTGVQTTNAMVAMIYDKMFKISSATNKKYTQGQLVNFVQVDALKMQFLSSQAPIVMRIPLLLVFCFSILFYYLGWSMISGVVVFTLAFITNTILGKVGARLQKKSMKFKDARIKALTESLNNIKMLKLYSWMDIFANLIKEKREPELAVLRQR